MNKTILQQAAEFKIRHKRKKLWQKAVTCMAGIVVFCTTYALILPAITMEQEVFCGLDEHVHSEECYQNTTLKSPVCTPDQLEVHAHTDGCYDSDSNLICGQADYIAHSHEPLCYHGDELICLLSERAAHTHSETCYEVPTEIVSHVHSDSCYIQEQGELICLEEVREGHTHAGGCFQPGENLLCLIPENHVHEGDCFRYPLICTLSTDPHSHNDDCYDPGTELQCTVPVNHLHEDGCYTSSLTCTIEEEGHEHTDECFTSKLTCTIPEQHAHADLCYKPELVCTLDTTTAHSHGSECYSTEPETVCETEENHIHVNSCYEQILQCQLPEDEGHAHADDCYQWNDVLSCGMEEGDPEEVVVEGADPQLICTEPVADVHTHTDSCFELVEIAHCTEEHTHTEECEGYDYLCKLQVHEHTLSCYSNPEADVESAAVWEATLSRVELTGDPRVDLVAIAQTQLGYTESSRNYAVWEDNTTHGYTRYGDWYGSPYGDWCAMFVSFCLHYADVDNIPMHWGCRPWIEELTGLGLYHSAEEYTPQPGDIIFYDWEGDDLSDHVGIVAEIIPATQTTPAVVRAIEGNSSNCVRYVEYDIDDPQIMGYSELPEQEEDTYYCGIEEHTHNEECYDAEGNLICQLPEHTHTDDCLVEVIYYCGKDEHTHTDSCYDAEGTLTCELEEHTHTEVCMTEPPVYYCGEDEHTHSEGCYDAEGNLICQLSEHIHTDDCQVEVIYYCGKDEHTHADNCFDAESSLICELEEHAHSEECLLAPVVYYCGLDEHAHGSECYDAEGNLICIITAHAHTDACITPTYLCGMEAHLHSDECYDAEGNLVCGREEHSHTVSCKYDLSSLEELSDEDREKVLRVINLIEEMPSADEIDAKLAEFKAAEDTDGMEAWEMNVYKQIHEIYLEYSNLGNELQPYVVNAKKLLDLEYIWSAALIVIDEESTVSVSIPVSVMLSNGSLDPETTHSYSFMISLVDETGVILEGDQAYSDIVSIEVIGAELSTGTFELNFLSSQFTEVTQFPVTFYYRIEELQEDVADAIIDPSVYLAEIAVTKDDAGIISAELTKLKKDEVEVEDKTATFVNTLTEDLSINLNVIGSAAAQEGTAFQFTVTLTDTNDIPLANESYQATIQKKDDAQEACILEPDENGSFILGQFYHGNTAIIHGLPLGTKWTITEDNIDNTLNNYFVSWEIKTSAESTNEEDAALTEETDSTLRGEGDTASGEILPGATDVTFTNTTTYTLPDTGNSGTASYITMGVMLMLISAAFLFYRSNERKREII